MTWLRRLEKLEGIVAKDMSAVGEALGKKFAKRLNFLLTEVERCLLADHLRSVVGAKNPFMLTGIKDLDQVLQKINNDAEATALFSEIIDFFKHWESL